MIIIVKNIINNLLHLLKFLLFVKYYKSINERKAENKKLKQDKKKIDADKTMFLLEKMEKYELIDQTIMSNMTIISGYYDTINYIINKLTN